MSNSRFRERRLRLAKHMQDGDIFVIFSGDSEVSHFLPPDRNLVSLNYYYLTGLAELDTALMMIRQGDRIFETLFVPAMSEMEMFYMGKCKDLTYYREQTGIRTVDYRHNLDSRISEISFTDGIIRLLIACPNKVVLERPTLESRFVQRMRNSFPHIQIVDMNREILCMRQFKDEEEVTAIQKAVDLTGMAIEAAMQQIKPGMTEAQIKAICDYTARMNGSSGLAEAVIAAGANGTILHYCEEGGVFEDNQMAMVDLCVKYDHYVSDITRVFPVNGKFSPRQAYWYNICLKAQEMTVANMKPGANMRACGEEARAYVAEALMENGYIRDPAELPGMIGRCLKDYVTVSGVNHSIGLAADETGCCGLFQELQPGMVYTVEPGIYLGSEGLAIRIEDDFLVTEDGVICLSAGIPRTVEEIEKVMEKK